MRLHSKMKNDLRVEMASIKTDVSKIVANKQEEPAGEPRPTLRLTDANEDDADTEPER